MQGAPDGIDASQAAAAVQRAFEEWQVAMPAAVVFTYHVLQGDPPAPDAHDHRALVRWIHRGWDDEYEKGALAVTLTTHDPDSGRITDADIVLNAEQYDWTVVRDGAACPWGYDVQNVLTHEIGHLLGLAHEVDLREATMFPSSPQCETKKRDLDPDDVAGLDYLYETIGPAPGGALAGCATEHSAGAHSLIGVGALAGLCAYVVGFTRRRRCSSAPSSSQPGR